MRLGEDRGAARSGNAVVSRRPCPVPRLTVFGRSPKPVKIEVFAKTDLGKTRDHNEDRFLVADLTRGEASLQPAVREHEVGERGSVFIVAAGMGTTTTAVGILNDHVYLTQVGDSRAYLIRDGQAVQLTRDQSLMQRLVEAGELTEEEAARSERRNIILQALGPDPKVKVDLTYQEIRRGDVLVLCSDGLSGQVKKEEIAEIVNSERDLQAACDRLIALANQRGGPDNITVITARFDGEGLRSAGGEGEVGHQLYPLIDTETSTEPVPVYRGSPPPVPNRRARWRMVAAAVVAAALVAAAVYLVSRSP